MLKTTPFHPRTSPLVRAQTWRRWAGYQAASSYDPAPDREYAAIRNAAALIDISPLYKYLVAGPDAARLLDRMVTRDVKKCAIGQVIYTPWCDAGGKVIDDGTISRLDETTFRITSAEPNLRWLSMNAVGLNAKITDVSERTAALALQGPASRRILGQVLPSDPALPRYFHVVQTSVRNIPVTVSRTGYTGDLGYEIWADADLALPLWDALIEAGTPFGIVPCGIWAMDIARIEAGLIMLDVDYFSAHHAITEARKSSPYEINLGWAVRLDKGPFNGRRALRAEAARSPSWGFVGIEVQWDSLEQLFRGHGLPTDLPRIPWRTSSPIYRGNRQVGYATTGCWSPMLKKYIALAHLRAPHFAAGTRLRMEITVEHQRLSADALVRALPFFDPDRKRA
jgi:aminomethyltransferase